MTVDDRLMLYIYIIIYCRYRKAKDAVNGVLKTSEGSIAKYDCNLLENRLKALLIIGPTFCLLINFDTVYLV